MEARTAIVGDAGLLGTGLLADMARETQSELEVINLMNDPNGVYATCFECEAFRQ